MKRPLVFVLLFLTTGIIIGRYFSHNIVLLIIPVISAVLLFIKERRADIFTLPVISAIGFVLTYNSLSVKNPTLEAWAEKGEIVMVSGSVKDISYTKSEWVIVTLKTEMFVSNGETVDGVMDIRLLISGGHQIKHGYKLNATGQLSLLDFQRNPGAYDEYQYLKSRKIQYKMFVDEVSVTGKTPTLITYIINLRIKAAEIIDKLYPPREAGIMKALILGDKSTLDDEIKELYKNAGIYHVLAVSGLHVSVLAAILNEMFLLLRINARRAGIGTLIFLAFYCIMTGAGVATIRAVIMSGVVIAGNLFYHDSDTLSSVSFAAIILLLYEPLLLWDTGFIYSFSSVIGLCILTPAIEKVFDILAYSLPGLLGFLRYRAVKKYSCGCIAAFIATSMIGAYFTFNISPFSVVLNILLIPTVFITVLSGFISVLIGFLSIGISAFFSGAAYAFLGIYEFGCNIVVSLPFSVVLTGRPPLYIIFTFYITLILSAGALLAKKLQRRKVILSFCSFIIFIVFCGINLIVPKLAEVAFLDVGQGDSAVILKDGKAIMIDGGGNFIKTDKDVGKTVIMPFLNYKAINRLEAAFLSHIDSDHAFGLIEILAAGRIKQLFLPDVEFDKNGLYEDILLQAAQTGTKVVYLKAGDIVTFMSDIYVECLYPEKGTQGADNNQSLVLRVTYGQTSFLFTGDIESIAERSILSTGLDLTADILKVAHHGSKTSSTLEFLKAVSPGMAMVGVSSTNVYGHPHSTVTERFAELEIPFYATADEGAVIIKMNGETYNFYTMGQRDERKKR